MTELKLLRALTNAGWLTGGRIAGDVVGLILFLVLGRTFGPEGLGQYSLGLAIGLLMFAIVHLGLEDFAIRECAGESTPSKSRIVSQLLGLQLAVSALPIAILFLLYFEFDQETFWIVVLLVSTQVATAFSRTLFVPAFAKEAMVLPAVADLATRLVSVIATLILVYGMDTSLAVALIPFPLGGALLLLAAALSCQRLDFKIRPTFSAEEYKRIAYVAWPFAASVLVFNVYARADVVMLGVLVDQTQVGLYASAFKFLEVGAMPLHFLGLAAYPLLSATYSREPASFIQTAEALLRAALTVGALLALALICVVPTIIPFLLGSEFSESGRYAQLLSVVSITMAAAAAFVRTLVAAHLQILRLWYQTAGMALNVVMNLALIPFLGILGAIIATICAEVLTNALYFLEIRRRQPELSTVLGKAFLKLAMPLAISFGVAVTGLYFELNPFLVIIAASLILLGMLRASRFLSMDLFRF